MDWTKDIYQARIASTAARLRHAAGSPSPEETSAYQAGCGGLPDAGTAVVLGMTPELRRMAAERFARIVSIDASPAAIELFADWLPEDLRSRETILRGTWQDLPRLAAGKPAAILGDGIIGNLAGAAETIQLLETLRESLSHGGRCVMRNVILPRGLEPADFRFDQLLGAFRAGRIDAAEFGFTARILGFHATAYDSASQTLDNARVYAEIDAMERDGFLTKGEYAALARYRFAGRNFLPGEDAWRGILLAAGFGAAETLPCHGRMWHRYYPVQRFAPRRLAS